MAIPILKTKLYLPPKLLRAVPRPRLHARLDEGLRPGCKLILISAPAGFGKTTLASEWIWSKKYGVRPTVGPSTEAESRLAVGGSRPHAGHETASSPAPHFAWLSLDRGDDDPARFLAYLAAALRSACVDLDGEVLSALQSPQSPAAETTAVVTALLNVLAEAPGPLVMVLDDYHEITEQPVHDALYFLLDHLPPHVHLLLSTRIDPPWPLARLRARRAMIELRTPDLRFTLDEAATFVNAVMGLDLSAEDLAVLDARAEGWASGLQMAALALQGSSGVDRPQNAARFIQEFGGSHRFVLDYLVEEVLERQPAEMQRFLLQTSILDRMSAALCDAVRCGTQRTASQSVDSRARLDALERANLFVVPLDGERRWYRYHRLFADLLRARLQRTQTPEQVAALHRRASAWLEQHDLLPQAIEHALAAQDWERTADLIAGHAEPALLRGEVVTFWRWIDALPKPALRARPTLCFYYALTLLWRGRSLVAIESLLQDIEACEGTLTGKAAALRGLLAAFQGQISLAIQLSRRALEQLAPEERFARSYVTWMQQLIQLGIRDQAQDGSLGSDESAFDASRTLSQKTGNVLLAFMVENNRAELLMRRGYLERSAAVYRQALEQATDARGNRMPIAGQALVGLGELARLKGALEEAEGYFVEGIRLLQEWTRVGAQEGYVGLSRVLWSRGERTRAWEALEKARKLAADYDLTELDDMTVALVQAALWSMQGNVQAVQTWAEGLGLYAYIDTPLHEARDDPYEHRMIKYALPILARTLIAQERAADALRALAPLPAIAERRGRPGLQTEVHALQALAWRALGDLPAAFDALARALALAEPEGYVQVFLDEGAPMRALLVAFRPSAARLCPFVDRLLGIEAEEAAAGERQSIVEPLSEREQEVLRLLRTPLTQPEIADRLYVSVNTIRSHVKHIYEKLGVHGRTEAVERAQKLGLL